MIGGYSSSEIAGWMEASAFSPDEQLRQTQFRMDLVSSWDVHPGQRVLEVGCGQGDTTAVLAAAVGPTGQVVAVDVASPDYGTPVTLGDSAQQLKLSPVGEQIDFRFQFSDWSQLDGEFDIAVMALCSWYVCELDTLIEILRQLRSRAKRLCFAEWDQVVTNPLQSGHALAVKFQQDLGSFGIAEQLNIKSAWTREEILEVLVETGWEITNVTEFPEPGLADGKWEMQTCLALEPNKLNIPSEARDGFESFRSWILESVDQDQCLPIFSFVAN